METFVLDTSTLLSAAFALSVIVGSTEVVKRLLKRRLQEDFVNDIAPLISVLWGVFYGYFLYTLGAIYPLSLALFSGVIWGLAGSGVWDFGKKTIKGAFLDKRK